MTFILIQKIQKIMNDTNAEIKVAISKIARALEGISLGVALIALTSMLIASVRHSTDPKKVANFIISNLKSAAEDAEIGGGGIRNGNN